MVIYLDFEMNGIYGTSGYIIEIGAVKSNKEKVIDTFNCFVKLPSWIDAIDPYIKALTGINDDDLKNGRDFYEVLGEFIEWTADAEAIYCFGSSDVSSLGYTARKQDNKEKKYIKEAYKFSTKLIDLMDMIYFYYPTMARKSLVDIHDALCENKTDKSKIHRALYDSIILKEIHEKIKENRRGLL